jgi:hypothetical protein
MSSVMRWILFLALVSVPAWAALSGVQYSAFGLYLAIVAATAVVVLLVMRMIGPASFAATDQDLLDSQEDGS